jgi:HK97 family phage major capsid protein
MSFPALADASARLAAKRADLKSIFDEAGPTYDMSLVKSLPSVDLSLKGLLKGTRGFIPDGTKTTMTTSAGFSIDDPRLPLIVPIAYRPVELVDLIPKITTNVPVITWMEQTTRTNNAAETAEGATKPEAVEVFTERTTTVRKIAITLPVTDEQLADAPQVRAVVTNDLETMIRQRLSDQIAAGDGSAPNLRGILNVSGIQTQAKGADPTPDAIFKAMVLIQTVAFANPDAVVMNPLDWQDVRLLRTSDGLYIWGSPMDSGPQRIWGLQVVLANGMTQNTAVVGAWQDYARLAIRQDVTLDVGSINDDFTKNLTRVRAEMRAALFFTRPAAFCSVTGV